MGKMSGSKAKEADEDFVSDEVIGGSSGFMKFEDGENQFRVISKPVNGWEQWEDDEVTRTELADEPAPVKDKDGKMRKPKKFMSLVVIDRADDEIKVLTITQQSVIKGIKALSSNPKWGLPFSYDINIGKKGSGLKTKYTVTPEPKTVLEKSLIKAAIEKPCNLDALYDSEGDVWADVDDNVTEYFFK